AALGGGAGELRIDGGNGGFVDLYVGGLLQPCAEHGEDVLCDAGGAEFGDGFALGGHGRIIGGGGGHGVEPHDDGIGAAVDDAHFVLGDLEHVGHEDRRSFGHEIARGQAVFDDHVGHERGKIRACADLVGNPRR